MCVPKTLYHFTPRHLLAGCQRDGLTKGVTPLFRTGKLVMTHGWQWLTSDKSFDQPWCDPELSTLPYDRTGCRITIKFTKHYRKYLLNADQWVEIIKDCAHPYFFFEDNHVNWWVYQGRVKPSWFKRVDFKPVSVTQQRSAGAAP